MYASCASPLLYGSHKVLVCESVAKHYARSVCVCVVRVGVRMGVTQR